MQNQTCFLLSYLKYGDNDAILHCFSQELGYQSFFVRGIYAPKNKKKAYLFPLNLINITVLQRKNSTALQTISKIEKAEGFYDFNDVKSNTILFFVSDFLQQVLKNESRNDEFFQEIEKFLAELHAENFNSYIAIIFRILSFQGISPLLGEKVFLDAETGNFLDVQTHLSFNETTSQVWKNYISAEDPYKIKLKRNLRNQILESLILYYRVHFDGFFEPRSLAIIQEIFE